jgi:hypothetical protein
MEDRTLYEGEFEHSGSGRTVSIDVDLEHYAAGGGILILSLGGQQIISSWPDTHEGRVAMERDLQTIKHLLAQAQRAVREYGQSKALV